MFDKYREINIDEDPCVFLSCGHFYTVSSLDGIMKMKKFYNVEPATGTITSPGTAQPVMSGDSKAPGCPECRLPIRDIHRYNRIIKKALLDESTKRFIVMAHLAYKSLVDAVSKREMELVDRGIDLKTGSGAAVRSLRLPLKKQGLQRSIDKFTKSMMAAEQPYGRVNDLLASALAREDNATRQVLQIDDFIIQTGFQIRGQILQLRLTWALLLYYKMIFSDLNIDPKLRSELGDAVANQLQRLICNCRTIRERSKSAKLLVQEVEAMSYDSLFGLGL